jgi:hypothetical protein
MHDIHFVSIEKLDIAILYLFELLSSVAILLLAFGLIASMANVLTEGSVLSDNLTMQRIWAWTQCVAIDASVAGTILRTFQYANHREWIKTALSALLSGLLLFTAAIVSNIEALQQTLNVALSVAYAHVFVPVEVLIWIRSLCIVLLIVAHALRHIRPEQAIVRTPSTALSEQSSRPVHAEQIAARTLATVIPEQPLTIEEGLSTLSTSASERASGVRTPQPEPNNRSEETTFAINTNYQRIKDYRRDHPEARIREIARELTLSTSTVSKWIKHLNKQVTSEKETSSSSPP